MSFLFSVLILIISLLFSNGSIALEVLTLEDFQYLVDQNSVKVNSLRSAMAGSSFEKNQASLITAPQLFSEYNLSRDKSPILASDFSGIDRNGTELKAGLQMQTPIGLKPKIYAFSQNQEILNAYSLPSPSSSMKRQGYAIEAEMNLWKNGFGKEIRWQAESLQAISRAKAYEAESALLGSQIEANLLYFDQSFLQESISIQKELIEQGERLLIWVKKQNSNRLLEPVHVSQAIATLESRKLSLVLKEKQFNANLIIMSKLTGKELSDDIQFEKLDQISKRFKNYPESVPHKKTLKAISELLNSERISTNLNAENFKPDLNLKVQYLTYTKTDSSNDTHRCTNFSSCRTFNLSLSFSMPLDFSNYEDRFKSANARVNFLNQNYDSERQNSEIEWHQLITQKKTFEKQIKALQRLIEAQSVRLTNERERQKRGRATTYDIILSEQDLAESKIHLAETKSANLSVQSKLKIFEEILQ